MSPQYGPLVSYLESSFPLQLCTISASALVVYDTFLTLDTEVAVFWCHRLKLSSILYFVNRYVEIMSCIVTAVLIFPVRDQVSTGRFPIVNLLIFLRCACRVGIRLMLTAITDTTHSCEILPIFEGVCTMLPYFAWAVFSAFRAYALTDHNLWLATLVFILNVTFLVPDVYEYAGFDNVNLPAPYNCSRAFPPGAILKPRSVGNPCHHSTWRSYRARDNHSEATTRAVDLSGLYTASFDRGSSSNQRGSLLQHPIISEHPDRCAYDRSACVLSSLISLTDSPFQGYDDGSTTSLIMGQCIVFFRDAITSILISRFLLDLGSLSVQVDQARGQDDSLEGRFPSQLSYVVFASPECDVSAGTVRIE
ncbi:hypothetical protein OH76DRAFT_115569 [Lentinus brumalis]|uniref:DUF6533 domain-containing protein n=1 Tax=Lentinus brumalis TaxID=2498619 RepID=A0A371CPW2_9APHY|nr:hypothetical protein OH76DRAFT_115569 [Polyporus brumalis]